MKRTSHFSKHGNFFHRCITVPAPLRCNRVQHHSGPRRMPKPHTPLHARWKQPALHHHLKSGLHGPLVRQFSRPHPTRGGLVLLHPCVVQEPPASLKRQWTQAEEGLRPTGGKAPLKLCKETSRESRDQIPSFHAIKRKQHGFHSPLELQRTFKQLK